ncbi:response regulator [Rufibacter roseus]|uniref:Response regulator n=1 Tax=Rufibacter roseus TaxID=1567108 RepID=A0ABW2DFI7_9BACT|nr:response regulator [Rufibacter roseus]
MTAKSKICVIDDDEIYQFYSKSIIDCTERVQEVLQFFDGQEALDFFQQHQQHDDQLPELILLDLEMPYLDGWQFLDQYRKLELARDITLFVVSSSASQTDREKALKYPCVKGYITKPMTAQQFKEILDAL